MKRTARWMARGLTAAALGLCLSMPATAQEDPDLALLLKEAGERNPELSAARREAEAAASRVEPAAALDDPMLEAGLAQRSGAVARSAAGGHDDEDDRHLPAAALPGKARAAPRRRAKGGRGRRARRAGGG